MKTDSEIRVLQIDDDKDFLEVAKTILSDEGPFNIETAYSADEALNKLQSNSFDVIISDYEMPQKNGLELLKQLREKGITTPFVLFTGKGREEIAVQALNLGADRYINKHGNPETVFTELSVCIRQLHEKNLAKKMLWESEERFKHMVTNNKDLIMLTGSDGTILYLSPSCKNILGYEPSELIGKRPWIIHPDDLKYTQQIFQTALTKELRGSVDYRIITKQGQTKWVNHSFSQIIEKDKIKQIVSTLKDVTEAKIAQEKLVESEERFRMVVENSPIMMANLNRDLQYTWVHNPLIKQLSSKKILGKHIGENANIVNTETLRNELRGLIEKGGSLKRELYMNIGKETFLLESYFEAARNHQGEITGIRFTAYDITQRKQMENRLKSLEERWNFALESAEQGVWDYDAQKNKLFLSKKWKAILGYAEHEVKNEIIEWKKLLHPDDKLKAIQQIENFLAGNANSYTQEYRLLAKDGSYKWILSQGKRVSITPKVKLCE